VPKGGARLNSGPPPDPRALRRDGRKPDKDGWTTLPAGGRKGAVPPWPLAEYVRKADPAERESIAVRERSHWARVWLTPQAVVWEQLGWTHEVALYVRHLAMAELGDLKAASEARQWSDRLGLNPAALLRNHWRVSSDEVAPRRSSRAAGGAPSGVSMRDRLRAVNGGGD